MIIALIMKKRDWRQRLFLATESTEFPEKNRMISMYSPGTPPGRWWLNLLVITAIGFGKEFCQRFHDLTRALPQQFLAICLLP
jgi:hypothetical protein